LTLYTPRNRVFIVNYAGAYKEKISKGDEVIKVNGQDVQQYLAREVFPYLGHHCEHVVKFNGIENMLTGFKGTQIVLLLKRLITL
jgi:C-terminal processing protease CtpA/Prc